MLSLTCLAFPTQNVTWSKGKNFPSSSDYKRGIFRAHKCLLAGGSAINLKDIEVLVEASLVPRSFLVGGYVEACVVGYLAMFTINTNTAAILVLNIKITLCARTSSVYPDGT